MAIITRAAAPVLSAAIIALVSIATERSLADAVPSPGLAPATQPSTRPADPAVDSLIKQLGAEDFKDRQSATEQLKKMGADALPALKQATASDNPEVRTRAQRLINELEHKNDPPKPANAGQNALPPGPFRIGPGRANIRFRVGVGAMMPGVHMARNATVNINGDVYKLNEGPDGLKLTVTEAGKTTEYSAKNADELKTKDPEAYKIYEKFFGPKGQLGRPMINIMPIPLPPQPPPQGQ